MFFVLSKILFYLVMPLFWILAALFVAIFSKKTHYRKRALVTATALLLFFTNPFFCNEAWLLWEVPPTPVSSLQPYDAGIILTGITSQNKTPHDRIYTNKGADRVLHPLQLYRAGKIGKIVISGGSGSLEKKYSSEASEIRTLLLESCVPPSDILMEDQSRNTRENALFTKDLLQRHPELKSLLLVTSAFHMRRAEGCFQKVGIQADAFSTDFYSHDRAFSPDALLLPQEAYLEQWQKLFHEVLGYWVYKLMRYC